MRQNIRQQENNQLLEMEKECEKNNTRKIYKN